MGDTLVSGARIDTKAQWTLPECQAHSGEMNPLQTGTAKVPSLVSIVDDDESMRESLPDLIREFGFAVQAFSCAEEFLVSDCVGRTRCLILDVAMPGMSGFDLQRELKHLKQQIPIIFMTGQKDEAVRRRALEQGAAGFLLKPFSDTALLDALNIALRGASGDIL